MRNIIQKGIKKEIGELYDIKHFNPKYNPWDQRLCMVPDSDLFKSIKEKKVEIETDTIEEFTPNGILLKSGKELEADIIVTATGLNVQLFGGMTITVNDKRINTKKLKTYRGVMFSDLPNFAFALGYTNASWTLKSDLNCHYVTRLINFLDENKLTKITPIFDKRIYKEERLFDFDAGYVLRAEGSIPKQGSKSPWRNYQNYIKDSISLKYGKISDGCLVFK
jgi:monooxygenase